MSIFSKLKDAVESVNETAASVGKSTVTDYGEPEYTLYTALDWKDIHRKIEVTDEEGNVKYYTKSNVIAIKGKTDIMDAAGNQIAHLEKRPISLHEKHFITMSDGRNITLSNELFHIVKDVTNIEELGWKLKGNIIGLSFNLLDEHELPIATISQKMISIHDKYSIEIYKPEHEQVVVVIVISLEKMMEDRAARENTTSFDD